MPNSNSIPNEVASHRTDDDANIVVYGTNWCWDCTRVRRFLDQHKIAYEWINIDKDPQAEKFVLKTNRGMRSVPTIVFPDGSILVEPSNAELAKMMEISTN